MMKGNDMNVAQVLALVAKSSFRLMDSYDRQAFAGTESSNALIHYPDEIGEEYTIIIDGDQICLIDEHGYESHYVLDESIFA